MCVMNELAVTRSGESQFMKDVSSRADLFAKMWLQQTRGARGVYRVRMRAGSHYSVRYDWSRAHSYTHPGRVDSRRTCRFTVRGAPVFFSKFVLRISAGSIGQRRPDNRASCSEHGRKRGNRCRPKAPFYLLSAPRCRTRFPLPRRPSSSTP